MNVSVLRINTGRAEKVEEIEGINRRSICGTGLTDPWRILDLIRQPVIKLNFDNSVNMIFKTEQ